MKTFEIGVWEEQGGYLTVEAKNKEEAKHIAYTYIEDFGFEMSKIPHTRVKGLRATHRNVQLV